ncbi:MAG TPA: alpha/beta fold hydrolase [Actinocrinis sp.]|nr:alpha/beta fold hydrolase [Actinocrinis sp.]
MPDSANTWRQRDTSPASRSDLYDRGVKLHYRQWGSGERVAVLLHGRMADSGCWWQVGPALADRGYRVIAVDLLGHGRSPRSEHADVESFVASLLESVPEEPALAMGHSMGGTILAAAVERLRPQRAVYIDVPFASDRRRPVDRVALTAELSADKAARTLETIEAKRSWWSRPDMLAEVESARLWDVPTMVSLSASAAGHDYTPTTAIPSLMVRAEPSRFVSAQYAAQLEALGFEVRSVAGAGHSVWYGYFGQFMAALEGWI